MITKKFRFLTFALIFSGALNIALLAAFAYSSSAQISIPSLALGKKEISTTNGQILASMSKLSFRELVSFLTNRDGVEEGYSKRDLAIACLVAYHHFNLAKALPGAPLQVRTLVLPNQQTLDLFPGLSEEQFDAIIRFAYQEKWPLTTKGLFIVLQNQKKTTLLFDESLEEAFFLTPEFHALKILFQKTGAFEERRTLLHLALDGSFDLFAKFAQEQAALLDVSIEKRRALLLEYLSLRSPTAAQILLHTDLSYVLKKLEDRMILELLSLLQTQSEEGKNFCIELLRSPRSDAVWQIAAQVLYRFAGQMPEGLIDPKKALSQFSSARTRIEEKPVPPSVAPSIFHVVKEGENLWKISRLYKVKLEEIVKLNGLEKNALFPGMTLKIPESQGTGSEPP